MGISQQGSAPTSDVVEETPRQMPSKRPEQQKDSHDQSDIFGGASAPPSSPIFQNQLDQGRMLGFDFARDPLKQHGLQLFRILTDHLALTPLIKHKALWSEFPLRPPFERC
jgi:hypothetical protein